ncbi:MAG: PIG-L family deacetylase [Hyphomonadaceae bacterium]|nr:PIG-L family deacetylase [Hyphomonadaceae bacterium]
MTDSASAPARILAIGAHPDDVEIYCLGLLLRLKRVGWEIGWAVATDGQASLPDGAEPDLRRGEALKAGALFRVTPQLLGLMDGALRGTPDDQRAVEAAIKAFRPDVLVTHNRDDYHPDHRTLARLVREACPANTLLLEADTMLGDGFLPDLHVDITDVYSEKMRALAAHKSQASPAFKPKLEVWSGFRALSCGVKGALHGEGYRTVPTAVTRRMLRRLISDLS